MKYFLLGIFQRFYWLDKTKFRICDIYKNKEKIHQIIQ